MFPTTIWTTIRQAGEQDAGALDDFAERYRRPVLEYVQRRGFRGADGDDICQDVFLRVLKGGVLAKFRWQNGYGGFSVSASQAASVRRYIEDQENHHRTVSFQEELRGFLTRHGVEFDERYVWD